jgi:hypothetical protein
MTQTIKVDQLFNFSLLAIIENDLKNGITYTFEFSGGKIIEIKDLAAFENFLKERKIK